MDPVKKEMIQSFLARRLGTIRGVINYHLQIIIQETWKVTKELQPE